MPIECYGASGQLEALLVVLLVPAAATLLLVWSGQASLYLLVGGLLPHWERLRGLPRMRRAVNGVNAGVIGLLAAVLWDPVLVTGIRGPVSAAIALGVLALLVGRRAPSWAVVFGAAGAGALLL